MVLIACAVLLSLSKGRERKRDKTYIITNESAIGSISHKFYYICNFEDFRRSDILNVVKLPTTRTFAAENKAKKGDYITSTGAESVVFSISEVVKWQEVPRL